MYSSPYFSICIPSFNRADTLHRCLDSLVSQTYKNFEVILVDDGSTDLTELLVNQYTNKLNLIYLKKSNGGKHTALNVGIRHASNTELFMILDSDDWLRKDALERFFNLWEINNLKSEASLCGIMLRCEDQYGNFIGKRFPCSPYYIDYVTFHFGDTDYGDCNECIRTSIIKQYQFPEPLKTKFVPEFYIFDQIGVKYRLHCSNEITELKEYREDGITLNSFEYVKKNWIGFFCALSCRLEKVVPFSRGRISKRQILSMWYDYWRYCYYDKNGYGERVTKITLIGYIGKFLFLFKRILVALSIKEEV